MYKKKILKIIYQNGNVPPNFILHIKYLS